MEIELIPFSMQMACLCLSVLSHNYNEYNWFSVPTVTLTESMNTNSNKCAMNAGALFVSQVFALWIIEKKCGLRSGHFFCISLYCQFDHATLSIRICQQYNKKMWAFTRAIWIHRGSDQFVCHSHRINSRSTCLIFILLYSVCGT